MVRKSTKRITLQNLTINLNHYEKRIYPKSVIRDIIAFISNDRH